MLSEIESKAFLHRIPITVSGKAGETKIVEVKASTEDRLLLFRSTFPVGYATDTADGQGAVLIVPVADSGRTWQVLTKDFSQLRFSLFDTLHPRQSAHITFRFIKDCTVTMRLEGMAVEVKNEGVYAIEPPAKPCNRAIPESIVDPFKNDTVALETASHRRCDHCWHVYRKHATWPWHERKLSFDVAGVDSGQMTDVVVVPGNLVVAHSVILEDFRLGNGEKPFATDGLAVVGSKSITHPDTISFWGGHNLIVPEGGSLLLRVKNRSGMRYPFKGSIVTQEFREVAASA